MVDILVKMLAGLVCWMAMTSAPPDSVPPLSPYGTLHGSVFQYSRNLVAFESDNSTPNKCVLIGGLSDGLLPTPYAAGLDQTCRETGWTLVQPILSSSYLGFGNGDLERDTKELRCAHSLRRHLGAPSSPLWPDCKVNY